MEGLFFLSPNSAKKERRKKDGRKAMGRRKEEGREGRARDSLSVPRLFMYGVISQCNRRRELPYSLPVTSPLAQVIKN